MKNIQKTIGIIGGMGPMATADLFMKLIQFTAAAKDAEHMHILVDNNPKTPDRTAAIVHGAESPLPYLIASGKRLETAGADFLLIPCITSHYFLDDLTRELQIPVMSIIEETAKYLQAQCIKKVVVLATDGTRISCVFDKGFSAYGIEILYPCEAAQKALMDVIYKGIKAGSATWNMDPLNSEVEKMLAEGAEAVILGCTELPLAAVKYGIAGKLINPTDLLARAAILHAGYALKTIEK